MEVAVLQQLPQRALDAHIHKVHDVEASSSHGGLVGEFDAVHPFHAQHAARGVRPDDARRADAGNAAVQLLRGRSCER